jgi:lysophospholipid acyltransferase (LPLAT)-like uncharacterized protein
MKKRTKKKIIFLLVSKLGWLLILLLGKLCFIQLVGRHRYEKIKREGAPLIFLLWHGRMLLPIYIHRYQGIAAMVSLHGDGEMIAQAVHRLGFMTVRGSSTRGGKQAFHEMVDVIKNRGVAAMMPDGPQGPRHQFKMGTIYIAQQTGAYLLPITFASKRKIEFNSWDRFNLATPFSKAVVIYGKPRKVPPRASAEELENLRQQIEREMIEYEYQADAYFKK